jgi:molybdopterin molybdotransferase
LPAEEVPLAEAHGRVLAADVVATDPVPPFRSSVVDGFAVRAADVATASAESPVELVVESEITAGDAGRGGPASGHAVRIMTGAPLPADADAVVMLEWTEWEADRVLVRRPPSPGGHVRNAGEDVAAGEAVVPAGTVLGPAALGVCASVGCPRVPVRRRPRVAVLATGDELLAPHEPLVPGRIRSSNDWTIGAQAREAGAEVIDLGFGRDDEEDLASRLEGARSVDVLLTSGGVSVGDRDLVRAVLDRLGFRETFWRVLASPGKPLLCGRLGDVRVFGLPGNPVSSMVAFENFVRPVLRLLLGDPDPERPRVRVTVDAAVRGPADRRHFARVRVSAAPDGLRAREVGPHGSGNLTSVLRANGLLVVPEGRAAWEAGDVAEAVLLGVPDGLPGGGVGGSAGEG